MVGNVNAHHPPWDSTCDAADDVGDRVATWLDRTGWTVLNSGKATRVDSQIAPDIAVCALSLARRSSWMLDDSLGSDHRVMKMTAERLQQLKASPQGPLGFQESRLASLVIGV